MSDKKKAPEKKRFSIGALFYNNKFVAVFSLLSALVLWFSMAFTNTEEFPVPIYDVPVTIKIPEAAQADGLKCFSPQTLKVTVYIKGNSLSVHNVTADDIGLETQITETVSGAKTYLATIASSKKGYVTDYEIDRIEPSIVQLTLDYSEEKSFVIGTGGVSASAAEGHFVGSVAATPESVTIPMIVAQNRSPFTAATIASGIPLTSSQIRLSRNEPTPPPYRTSFPKGKKESPAILKHCIPTGIPMMVMHHSTPAAPQQSPCQNPPQRNQIAFPKQPMQSPPA